MAQQYTLTMIDDGHCLDLEPGTGKQDNNTPIDISATAKTGYTFYHWTVISGDAIIANAGSASTTVTLHDADATIKAWFEFVYCLITPSIVGDIKCYIILDSSLQSTLTFPDEVSITNVGEIIERIDRDAGVVDLDNVQLDIREDYSTYAEGFWNKVINGYPQYDVQIMLTIMEGNDETFLFRGRVYRTDTTSAEAYISGTNRLRTLTVQLICNIENLKNVNISSLITECASHKAVEYNILIRLGDIVASMIKLLYNINFDASLVINNSTEILAYQAETSSNFQFTDLYMHAFNEDGSKYGYFDDTQTYAWVNRFASAYELLQMLCQHFGCIPRYQYGTLAGLIDNITPANNKHRIILNSRGRSYSHTITMDGNIIKSDFTQDTPLTGRNIRITDYNDNTQVCWSYHNALHDTTGYTYSTNFTAAASFDIDFSCDFTTICEHPSDPFGYPDDYRHLYAIGYYPPPITYIKYWNYSLGTPAYEFGGAGNSFVSALGRYLFYRFNQTRPQYTRQYDSIKANNGTIDSQRALRTLVGHNITDLINGVPVVRTYYASEVHKNIMENKATVIWVLENY